MIIDYYKNVKARYVFRLVVVAFVAQLLAEHPAL